MIFSMRFEGVATTSFARKRNKRGDRRLKFVQKFCVSRVEFL